MSIADRLIVPFVVTYVPNHLLLCAVGLLNSPQGRSSRRWASRSALIFPLRQHFQTLQMCSTQRALTANLQRAGAAPSSLAPTFHRDLCVHHGSPDQYCWWAAATGLVYDDRRGGHLLC